MTQCALHEYSDSAGNCNLCPAGGDPIENCTIHYITYDSWCAGTCQLFKQCQAIQNAYVAAYIEWPCVDDCGYDDCALFPEATETIYDWQPSACGCVSV